MASLFRRSGKYWLLLACHLLLAMVAFKDFRLNPTSVVFNADGDGLRGNYALMRYTSGPESRNGFFGFDGMNYPEQEYLITADCTPMFAVPFRWFCRHVWDVSAHALPVYQVFIILNIPLCGLLLLWLFRRIARRPAWLPFALSIVLPWVNVQVLRIWRGHLNLSMSAFVVAALCLLVLWHRRGHSRRARIWIGLAMAALPAVALTAHGYFLPMLAAYLSFGLLFYAIYNRRNKARWRPALAYGLAVPLLSLVLSVGVLRVMDGWLSLRSDTARGYDWTLQKVQIPFLFSGYPFHTLPFPMHFTSPTDDSERASYLGSIGLWALLVIAVAAVANRPFRKEVGRLHRELMSDPMKGSMILAGIMMIIMAMGEKYPIQTANEHYTIDNWLNPLVYMHWFTDKVEQFRSLERFMYPGWFAFYIYIAWLLAALCRQYGRPALAGTAVVVALFGGVELKDFIDTFQARCNQDNQLAPAHLKRFNEVPVRYADYQAILPFPFFVQGSEDYAHTIDDVENVSEYCFQLSLASGLPIMTTKLGRVLPLTAWARCHLVADDTLYPYLKRMLNDKPVLIIVDTAKLNDPAYERYAVQDSAKAFYRKSVGFIHRHPMTPVGADGGWVYYCWYPLRDPWLR